MLISSQHVSHLELPCDCYCPTSCCFVNISPMSPMSPSAVPQHLTLSASQTELIVCPSLLKLGLLTSPALSCYPSSRCCVSALLNFFVLQTQQVSPNLLTLTHGFFWCRYCLSLFAHLISACSLDHFIWEGTSVCAPPPPHTHTLDCMLLTCASLECMLLSLKALSPYLLVRGLHPVVSAPQNQGLCFLQNLTQCLKHNRCSLNKKIILNLTSFNPISQFVDF